MLYQYVYNSFEPLFKRLFHNFLHLTSKRAVQKWCQLGGGWVLVLQMMVPDDRRGGANHLCICFMALVGHPA